MIYEYISNIPFQILILNKEYYFIIIISHIIWWLLYFFVDRVWKIEGKLKTIHDSKTRIISIIHASIIFWAALYDLLFFQSDKCGDTNSHFQNVFMMISFAYFLYDLINCILLDVSCLEMVVHHIFCMSGYYVGIAFNNSANEMMRALVVAEVTNPIMHIRMILKNFKLKHSKSYLLLEVVYIILYLIARMIYGARVIYFTVFCKDNLWIVKIAGALVWLQSVLFSKRMIHIILHKYKEYKERCKKGVFLFWFSFNKQIEELDYYKLEKSKKKEYIP